MGRMKEATSTGSSGYRTTTTKGKPPPPQPPPPRRRHHQPGLVQPCASLRHLETNRYPMCPVSLAHPPGLALRRVSPAIIDTCGTYPFLLFRLKHGPSGLSVHCVRGSASFSSERAIDSLYTGLMGRSFSVQVEGGGFIKFGDDVVQIHGESAAYGRSDHHLVGKLVKFCYPLLKVQYEPDSPLQEQQQTKALVRGTKQLIKTMGLNNSKSKSSGAKSKSIFCMRA